MTARNNLVILHWAFISYGHPSQLNRLNGVRERVWEKERENSLKALVSHKYHTRHGAIDNNTTHTNIDDNDNGYDDEVDDADFHWN